MQSFHFITVPIEYVHGDLISNLDLFDIPETIFDVRAFKFHSNLIVNVNFDICSGFC